MFSYLQVVLLPTLEIADYVHHKADCLKDQGCDLDNLVLVLRFYFHSYTSFEFSEQSSLGPLLPWRTYDEAPGL